MTNVPKSRTNFQTTTARGAVVHHCTESIVSCDEAWESAYERFETPDEEVAKFTSRFRSMKIDRFDKSIEVVDLFCGRGNGMIALDRLGFKHVEGVDLSLPLLQKHDSKGRYLYLADCRELPFDNGSKDLVIVQGGLHHLPKLPDDVRQTVCEVKRVLRPGGRFAIVEPYPTQTLPWIHWISERPFVRTASKKLDALAVMTDRERVTYENWLANIPQLREEIMRSFEVEHDEITWTKWMFVGRSGVAL